jgi:AraC family transcriptional regulator, regulatory protein of adaptative response / methylated-DNA-[protein]-cysteine methyltransferase
MAADLSIQKCWRAVLARDERADGRFFYAVRTTKVYCRPSCAARHPLRSNVVFFTTPTAAQQAGFRPCKRCTPHHDSPQQREKAWVRRACRLIEKSEQAPKLVQLAKTLGLSPAHLQRRFKAQLGISPKTYAKGWRTQQVRKLLRSSQPITQTIYDAGYNSSANFYIDAPRVLGMPPTAFRKGGKDMIIQYAITTTTLGMMLVGSTSHGICAIFFGTTTNELERELQQRFPAAQLQQAEKSFLSQIKKVVQFVEKPTAIADFPLDIQGSVFQQKVWQALQSIPFGTTVSYADLALKIGKPRAARAVAAACAANRLAVVIPCHRVVRSTGALSGYRWGVARKKALLEREGI